MFVSTEYGWCFLTKRGERKIAKSKGNRGQQKETPFTVCHETGKNCGKKRCLYVDILLVQTAWKPLSFFII